MTPEDKRLIAEYMGWYDVMVEDPMNKGVMEKIITKHNHAEAYFDLNDAGLCVAEMQKRGELWSYTKFACNFFCRKCVKTLFTYEFVACFFNPENFFGAMAAWLKEEKKC